MPRFFFISLPGNNFLITSYQLSQVITGFAKPFAWLVASVSVHLKYVKAMTFNCSLAVKLCYFA